MGLENRLSKRISIYSIVVIVFLILGTFLRVWHLFVINMQEPYRLGGLFYEFAQQIVNLQFRLPLIIPYYSQNGLPFAYPPLSFYLEALLIKSFNPPKFALVNILPAVLSVLSLFSFFFLANKVLKKKMLVAAALIFFATMPNAFTDQIEAGGLAESLGTLVFIWYLYFLCNFVSNKDKKSVLLSGLFLGLNVLSSPGGAYAAILVSLLFALYMVIYAFRTRKWKVFVPVLVIAGIGLLASSPYWLTSILHHGAGIIFSSFMAQHNSSGWSLFIIAEVQKVFEFSISCGSIGFLWDFFIFLGLISCLVKLNLILPATLILLMLIPREGVYLAPIAGALLAASGTNVLWEVCKQEIQGNSTKKIIAVIFGVLLVTTLTAISIIQVKAFIDDKQWDISVDQITSLENTKSAIPSNMPVLLIGNEGFKEWGPQILEREVINTKYGLEWQPDELVLVSNINLVIQDSYNFNQLSTNIEDFIDLDELYLVSTDIRRMDEMLRNSDLTRLSTNVVYRDEHLIAVHIIEK